MYSVMNDWLFPSSATCLAALRGCRGGSGWDSETATGARALWRVYEESLHEGRVCSQHGGSRHVSNYRGTTGATGSWSARSVIEWHHKPSNYINRPQLYSTKHKGIASVPHWFSSAIKTERNNISPISEWLFLKSFTDSCKGRVSQWMCWVLTKGYFEQVTTLMWHGKVGWKSEIAFCNIYWIMSSLLFRGMLVLWI